MTITNDIGSDILDVLEELGSQVSIYNYDSGESTTEYIDSESVVNQVYPWTSHFVIKADFAYNTVAVPGSLITLNDSLNYLLVALAKERFENLCIAKEGILYLCNTYAQIQRRQETNDRDDNYDPIVTWPIVYSGELGLFTEEARPEDLKEEKYGVFSLLRNTLYLSDSLDVRSGDRIWVNTSLDGIEVSGEVREVRSIEDKKYPGIKICLLGEDTRE